MPSAELNLRCSHCGSEFLFSPQSSDDNQESSETPHPHPPVPVELESEQSESEMETGMVEAAEKSADTSDSEMADVFADTKVFSGDEQSNFQREYSGVTEEVESEEEDLEIEGLSLDLDKLEDVKYGSSEDELDFVDDLSDDQTETEEEHQIQFDEDEDLDNLLKQVEKLPSDSSFSMLDEETGGQTETDVSEESSDTSSDFVETSTVTDKKRSFIPVISGFLVFGLALLAACGLWQYFTVDMAKHLRLVEIENQRLRLPSERVIIVLRGKVVNSSNKFVKDLKVKGVLLDEAGRAVAEVVTVGGVSYSEEELDLLAAGKLEMRENSIATLRSDGGELSFTIPFCDYPEGARTCYAEISSFKVKKGFRP